MRKLTRDEFIARSQKSHGDLYDYSLVVFKGVGEKVEIVDPEFGPFWQIAKDHMNGRGNFMRTGGVRYTTSSFISKAREVHGETYIYDKVSYINSRTPVIITDPEFGDYCQTPFDHLQGHGNPKRFRNTTEIFVEKARAIHGNLYDYRDVEFVDSWTPVTIIDPIFGSFRQTPHVHLMGSGNPTRKQSHGERKVAQWLERNDIAFDKQTMFESCRHVRKLRFDFFLPEHRMLIEYHGKQHYEAYERFGGEPQLELTQERDALKRIWAHENEYRMLEIAYTENIDTRLSTIFS